ncbi:Meiotically up-regulated protein 86 protein [Coniosporium apollinis]|uniref:Meiotically up-regulated protein 86 protein n=2 Tax=Coniosporium TaxID=2810619 RepID=A0ABQ9NKI6_9PEZI|nr:Meiotically up-regulated protein 86 protein [Cladosporium sp. JES 115]KAJ9658473.1 Meiotically up-regulated protein 86 protein [Coniosporium apollinis]
MATAATAQLNPAVGNGYDTNGINGANGMHNTNGYDHATAAAKQRNYGGNPLAHIATNNTDMLPAFGGQFQPGLYKESKREFANPAPLGLCAFALTTFVLSCINMGARGIEKPNLVVAIAYGYGGLVQLLAGMWEMAVGNTFGATALSSYGGFWLSFAIILTPGGFNIREALEEVTPAPFYDSFGIYLMGWFIFTTILLICTLRSTVAFFLLFFFLDMAFLMLGISYLHNGGGAEAHYNVPLHKAGGAFGILAAFMAWYNALAGIANTSNSFFILPVVHFPWSDKGRKERGKPTLAEERGEKSE